MNNKQKIIKKLRGELIVTEIKRNDFAGHPAVKITFEKNGKEANCIYTLYGEDGGIEECNYEEECEEDIYAELQDWIEDNLTWSLKIKWNKEIIDW